MSISETTYEGKYLRAWYMEGFQLMSVDHVSVNPG